ncbi:SDR family oxidoreductase [Bosea robiniae]|uniref:NAD(P)-dependent dehydrogenase, short-chain alcohol dehydrogenase family n=1 Tax=Bosea robiniae TaxID=1036780 RepID=A0ABY0P4C1_9HYPH|nr:SDR family oxidoreductase [Bosea robiniae]SDH24132.1 NAD(P)-dependent dehydrogenase, short-chain alcohol dehydrogenase family [Bosea robiniae]
MFRDDVLKGQHILVTGGGTGLGREMAHRFAGYGARVAICGRREAVVRETAEAIARETGAAVDAYECDIRSPESVRAMVDRAWLDHGPLTGLVNNAAGNFISRTEDLTANGFNAISDIVLRGTFYVTNAIGQRWIAEQRKGSVLSILATFTRTGAPFVVPSAMSKAGIEAMTRSLAIEWGRYGIRLNAISPGIFPTEGASARLRPTDNAHDYERSVNPMGRLGQKPELTTLATFLMAPGCEWLSGETIAVDGAHGLANGAYFTNYLPWTDAQWQQARERIRGRDRNDKAASAAG